MNQRHSKCLAVIQIVYFLSFTLVCKYFWDFMKFNKCVIWIQVKTALRIWHWFSGLGSSENIFSVYFFYILWCKAVNVFTKLFMRLILTGINGRKNCTGLTVTHAKSWRSRKGVPFVKLLNCDHEMNDFELQSRYYIHFRTNIQGRVWTSLFPQ